MYDIPQLKQRLIVIKNAGLDDATILDENYTQLMGTTPNPDEQTQFSVLRSLVKRRIKELTEKSDS
jgi:hypothetical protein